MINVTIWRTKNINGGTESTPVERLKYRDDRSPISFKFILDNRGLAPLPKDEWYDIEVSISAR